MGLCTSKATLKTSESSSKLRRQISNTDLFTPKTIQNKNGLKNEYKILDPIGHGFFGEVRKAESKKTKQIRAIKMVNKKKISENEENLIKNEINLLMKIDHPHVVKIYEFFETDGYIHIVMEFVKGIELSTIWNRMKKNNSRKNSRNNLLKREKSRERLSKKNSKKKLTKMEKKISKKDFEILEDENFEKHKIKILTKIFKQIFLTINYLHGIGIVHRDLKGENILWDGKNITILDFGCSFYFKENEKLREKVGTPLFVAPEVLEGSYNEKCDIWSLGILFYILFVEKKPFLGGEKEAIFQQIKDLDFVVKIEDLKCEDFVKEFMGLMLEGDVEKRNSAENILKNDFFKDEIEQFEKFDDYYDNIIEFYKFDDIKKSILHNIINELVSKRYKNEIIIFFKFLNKNNDGFLSKHEICEGFKNFKKFDKKVFDEISINQFEKINFSTFLTAVIKKNQFLTSENFLKIAKVNDKENNDGVDYIKYFKSLKIKNVIKKDYNKILRKIGIKKKDNKILSYEMFAKFLDKVLR